MPKAHRDKDTYEKILDVSLTLFAEKGFDAAGVSEIARNVGIVQSVIYYHFKNKDEILETLFERFIKFAMQDKRQLVETFLEGPTEQNYNEMTDEWIQEKNQQLEKWKRMCRVVLMEATKKNGRSDLLFKLWEENMKFFKEQYGHKLKKGADDPKGKSFMMAFFLWVLPSFNFLVFEEDWIERYGMDVESFRKTYSEMHGEFFKTFIRPNFWKK
jgi:AcrR family transcriptional regulator